MDNSSINELKTMIDNLKFKSSKKSILNPDYLKLQINKENLNIFNGKAFNYRQNLYSYQKIKLFEKLFQLLTNRMQQNKFIFEHIKLFLINNDSILNKNINRSILPFYLKKEIFIDKYKTNKKKEEYYTKCKNENNKNLEKKIFSKDMNYMSKTHSYNNILFYNNSIRYQNNLNLKKINKENSNNKFLDNDLKTNIFLRKTTQNFHHDSKIKKIENPKKSKAIQESQTIKNYQNSYIYSKRVYCQNRINKKEEKENLSIYNNEYNENVISKGSFTPYVIKNNDNSISFYKARIIKNNKKINNIFLLEDKRDYQIYTYNPNQGFYYHQNYLKNKNEIHSDRNIYKRKYSLDSKKEIKSF